MSASLLAIDDQDDNLALLEALLEPQGYELRTALDGPTGLALAHQRVPDLILLDLAMPGMDGFAVLEALRADARTRKVPVIVLTANHRDAASVERGLRLGATEYLTKPLKLDELSVRIRSTLRLAEAEREVERLRRDFASMLVHDMRAPLDGVRLALGTLKRRQADPLLDLATGALDDLGRLVEDLLQVNRLEEEGFTPERTRCDLAALAAESAAALRPIAEARGLTLDTALAPAAVEADPRLVRRIIDNLLANALKFTETGGVTLRVGPGAHASVADTGPGIPPEALPRLFDRQFHLERRLRHEAQGFGLGLAFCDRAARAMGGAMAVESRPGAGSTFTLTLPAADP